MPTANGEYYGSGNAVYDDYDYSDSSPQITSIHHTENGTTVNGHYQHDAYETPSEERSSFPLPPMPRLKVSPQDEISRHMLYETALVDCKSFDMLSIEEMDALKKEMTRIVPRIEATQRKLVLEKKIKDAAQNLQKLNRSGRADTPQSPESPRKTRRSIAGQRHSISSVNGSDQIHEEMLNSQKKVDELNDALKELLGQKAEAEGKLLRHTAAVLAQQREEADTQASSRHRSYDDDTVSEYEADEFDGIRDILGGRRISRSSKRVGADASLPDEYLQDMQLRLEHMNQQMRQIIEQAGRSRRVAMAPEKLQPPTRDLTELLNRNLGRLETNLATLEQEQSSSRELGAKLEDANASLRRTLLKSSQHLNQAPLPPPQSDDHHEHVGYLQSLIESVEHVFNLHSASTEATSKNTGQTQRLAEYETTIGGLWELLSAESSEGGTDSSRSSRMSLETPTSGRSPRISESFSLAAFSSRVQHIINRANAAKEQHDILRRQIQQQRELNGKSDAEKDSQIQDLQTNHDRMLAQHGQLQDELTKIMANHASSENEASQLRGELSKVESEFTQLHQATDARQQQHEELSRQVQTHRANHEQARVELGEAHAQLAEISATRSTKDKEMADLESAVARLTTDLTMAKAELEGAYGSRAERAKEAQDGEAKALKERSATLERELAAMTTEFEELTRESLELERERSQLDSMIDGLRERCETLEAQLSDEKVRWIGIKSPSGDLQQQQMREQTSMAVMRSEFKKMMRDARMEGVKLLRAEQEQRRALEAELRRLRQSNTPLRKPLPETPAT